MSQASPLFSQTTRSEAASSDIGSSLLTLWELLLHALVNGIAAPFVTQGIGALLDRLGDDEASQRPIRLEPRTLSL